MCRSVPHTAVRFTLISTSLMPGSGSGTSSSQRPRAASFFTRAFMESSLSNDPFLEQAAEQGLVLITVAKTIRAHAADRGERGDAAIAEVERVGRLARDRIGKGL